MSRVIATTFAIMILVSTAAIASDEVPAALAAITSADDAVPASLVPLTISSTPSRGNLLPSLYVSLAGLNTYDAVTTFRGLGAGAVEANGLMKGVANSPVALIAVKAGITTGSILASERLWKSGRRAQAIGMMLATNAMMVFVGARNTNVLRHQR